MYLSVVIVLRQPNTVICSNSIRTKNGDGKTSSRILKPYVKEGMHVLDLGCGPGVYTLELARIVGEKGTCKRIIY